MYARYIPPPKKQDPPPAVIPDFHDEPIKPAPVSQNSAIPYARYIPPPKGKAPAPVATLPQKIVFTDDDFPSPEKKKRKRNVEEENEPEVKEEKKPRRSTLESKEEADEPDNSKKRKKKKEKLENGNNLEDSVKESKKKKEKKHTKSEVAAATDYTPDAEADDVNKPLDGQVIAPVSGSPEDPSSVTAVDSDPRVERKDRDKKKKRTKEPIPEDQDPDSLDARQKKHKAVFEKKEKSLKREKVPGDNAGSGAVVSDDLGDGIEELGEAHGLEPLPQPEPVNFDGLKPSYETLPPWLAAPIRVAPRATAPFTELGIGPEAAKILGARGYQEAFAVQTAAIPLLLPSPDRQGDVVISAATGSGKTLAYVLPMVRDISQDVVTKLRALIVVPTRELVRQAQEACEVCSGALYGGGRKRVKIGIAMGSQSLRQEQATLMEDEQVYDPVGYEKWRLGNKVFNVDDSDDEDGTRPLMNTTKPLPDHVIRHTSKVDILICTPGRLVEHLNQTPGFTLDYVRWLVVDEADKLLAQSFQQWLDVVMERLSTEKKGARDFPGSNKSGVRKVILSATMTRDLSLLNSLKLRRPKLIVLEGQKPDDGQTLGVEGEHVLPDLLKESVVKIRNPNLKPLYLVDLLNSKHMAALDDGPNGAHDPSSDDESGEESSSDSSESESDSESSSDSESNSDSDPESEANTPPPSAVTSSEPTTPFRTTALIFTKSNESALRLSRLLALLSPRLAPLLGTLTSTTRTAERRRTLRAFGSGRTRILVASDLVARGIDLPNLDHVINYDVPAGPASYVHRVGRTARAGRKGQAWTLVTKAEAGWFWREVGGEGKGASAKAVRRPGKVERVRIGGGDDGAEKGWFSEERVKVYEDALEQLGKEADEMRKKGR